MERNARLGAAGRAGRAAAALKIAQIFLAFMLTGRGCAQCLPDAGQASQIHQSFEQHNWTDVVRLAAELPCRQADSNFEYGLALAHLQHWPQARAALLAGRLQSRGAGQERFDIELAGIAFERKRYPEAALWLRRALKLNPKDDYANNFAGTVYFLMGNIEAALKFWNRIHKPYVAALQLDPQLRIQRLLIERSFVFSPAAVLRRPDFLSTQARLGALGVFSAGSIHLSARADGNFDAQFHAVERDGFGSSRVQALVSTFAGAPYETVYPSYFNIGHTAENFKSLLRWDSQKLRAWLELSAPVHDLPQWRWSFTADLRDENWAIRRSFTGPAPPLGSLNLDLETFTGLLTSIQSGRLEWSMGAEFSHRNYYHVVYGSALTPDLVASGFELKHLASIDDKLIDVPEKRFSLTAGASSEVARLWSNPSHPFAKLQASALAHWFPQPANDRYEAAQQLRTGRTIGTAPFDEMFMLGVERDNDLWLHGHIGTRDRQKGSSPLGYSYFLSNTDLYRRIYTNGLLTVKAGPLLDIGRMGAPTTGLSSSQWLFDTGIEATLTVFGTDVVFTYGRDLRSGANAFYGTLAR